MGLLPYVSSVKTIHVLHITQILNFKHTLALNHKPTTTVVIEIAPQHYRQRYKTDKQTAQNLNYVHQTCIPVNEHCKVLKEASSPNTMDLHVHWYSLD